jgi:RNA polymerase sigma factor (sigma-70 family)
MTPGMAAHVVSNTGAIFKHPSSAGGGTVERLQSDKNRSEQSVGHSPRLPDRLHGSDGRASLESTFQEAYPCARRAAQVHSTAAVLSRAFPLADREDIEQEALTACWRALPRFDPSRSSLRTFVERVIANKIASLGRTRRTVKRTAVLRPLEEASSCMDERNTFLAMDLCIDVHRVLETLSPEDHNVALLLTQFSPSEASQIIGIPRSTFYGLVLQLRARFTSAGLNAVGGPGARR